MRRRAADRLRVRSRHDHDGAHDDDHDGPGRSWIAACSDHHDDTYNDPDASLKHDRMRLPATAINMLAKTNR
jgi:hypothetical protein